jgi:hypothetical protein
MAEQVCPRCRQRAFTWHVDEAVSRLTQWRCAACGYAAEENEVHEADCPTCGCVKSWLELTDEERRYRYCLNCGSQVPTHADA